MISRRRIWLLSLLILMGCGSVTHSLYDTNRPIIDERIRVRVDNRNFLDATLYICWGSSICQRLGSIGGKTVETYMTPWVASRAHIKVDFIGAANWLTESQGVNHGDYIWFSIPAYPRLP